MKEKIISVFEQNNYVISDQWESNGYIYIRIDDNVCDWADSYLMRELLKLNIYFGLKGSGYSRGSITFMFSKE